PIRGAPAMAAAGAAEPIADSRRWRSAELQSAVSAASVSPINSIIRGRRGRVESRRTRLLRAPATYSVHSRASGNPGLRKSAALGPRFRGDERDMIFSLWFLR